MKVLVKGRPQKGWSKEMTCTGKGNGGGGCGAKLLVEQADVHQQTLYSFDEGTTYTYFTCSECGVTTDFDGSSLPFTPTEDKNP